MQIKGCLFELNIHRKTKTRDQRKSADAVGIRKTKMVAELVGRTGIRRLLEPCRKSKLSTQSMHILSIKYYLFQLEKKYQEYTICFSDH